jgi:uncharacterized protein (TIGR02271 family)
LEEKTKQNQIKPGAFCVSNRTAYRPETEDSEAWKERSIMPTRTQSTVVALFSNSADAQTAANELKANGFSEEEIYISAGDRTESSKYERSTHHEGGITGWFKRVFGSDDEADRPYYEKAVSSGNILLSVDADEQNVTRAVDILNRHSPVDVHREGAGTDTGASSEARAKSSATGTGKSSPTNQTRAVPVVEEELRVGKRTVLRGGVRVYSRVVEQPVQENVNLKEERVRVERQRVNRPVKESDFGTGRDEVIEVEEYAEQPVVSKEARVVEEVRINKQAAERTETVRDTVRHTEVNVEKLGEESVKGTSRTTTSDIDQDFRTHFETNYRASGANYETYAPAYRYGYEMASDPRYKGKDFTQVEPDLRTEYSRAYPNSTWEKIKDSVRYGWNKVTGRSSSASSSG